MRLHKDLYGENLHDPKSHASLHEDGGTDELNVASLSGKLNDEQKAGFNDSPNDPSSIPDAMMRLRELEFIISSLETKIEILAATAEITFPC